MRKIFTILFAALMSVGTIFAESGECGENLTWTLDANGKLTISGSGNMYDFVEITDWAGEGSHSRPWDSERGKIKSIVVEEGVTSIGNNAFSMFQGYGANGTNYYDGPTAVSLPNSLTRIGYNAFRGCKQLTSVVIPKGVASIGNKAFSDCSGLTSVTINSNALVNAGPSLQSAFGSSVQECILGNSVTSIGDSAFFDCSWLTSITIPSSVRYIGYASFGESDARGGIVESITLEATTPPTVGEHNGRKNIFSENGSGCYSDGMNTKIFVPCGTLETYKQSSDWQFAQRTNCNYTTGDFYTFWQLELPYSSNTITIKVRRQFIENEGYYTSGGNAYIEDAQQIWNWNDSGNQDETWYTSLWHPRGCELPAKIIAEPYRGYRFVKWSDGKTDNPRTVTVTSDITLEPIFDIAYSGKCGKDSALTWTLDTTKKVLEITGKGELTENYTYGYFMESVIVGNEVSIIGEEAFYDINLKNIIIGSSVKVIERRAFKSVCIWNSDEDKCIHPSITCYGQRPPTVKEEAFDEDMPYSTIIYVPADYLSTYKAHDFWGLYDIRPMGATSVETNEVKVEPEATAANVAWPAVSGAATYELVIKDKAGNVICTLVFNANGQLTQLVFNAPARNNAPQQAQASGFSFTVTGLEEGTTYDLTLTTKDNGGNTLDEKTMSFTTKGEQGLDQTTNDQMRNCENAKIIRDGQLIILRGDRTYTLTGQEVR